LHGQLGDGTNEFRNFPILVNTSSFFPFLINGEKIIEINCGAFSSYIITEKSNIYGVGRNDFGQVFN
jgi:alpha-tubulin suppressor-like RCC1 family protein